MRETGKAAIVRRLFEAYQSQDRAAGESLLTDDFSFTSPYDDAIDKAAYFEHCWPTTHFFREHVLENIAEQDGQVFVQFRAVTTQGKAFRNVEVMTFNGGRICAINVYFGATYQEGVFQGQS
jgi:ketosteroid isomerase-like protein